MNTIHIHGGVGLQGNVRIQGSKNAALPILAATLLTKEETVLYNCPKIADVYQMLQLLKCLGCQVRIRGEGISVNTGEASVRRMPGEAVRGMRSSLCLLGALLGRSGEVTMEYPGGCVIGARPIDLHLWALSKMGVVFAEEDGLICGSCPDGIHGARIQMPKSSVGATQNVILAAVTAEGTTHLTGAAVEPEVTQLCIYLSKCGASIEGVGTGELVIRGGQRLFGTAYTVPADRIVAGTYLYACLGAGGSVMLHNAPVGHMEAVLETARAMGAECQVQESCQFGEQVCAGSGIHQEGKDLYVQAPKLLLAPKKLTTSPYPGFPTDMQSVTLAALCRAEGSCHVEETIFENRFRVVEPLRRMGACVEQLDNKNVIVRGPVELKAQEVEAAELRGGAALVTAGLMARGETVVRGLSYINRGYENICRDFRELGARIYSV